MVEKDVLNKIYSLIEEEKIIISTHCVEDCLKHYEGWNKKFIINALKKGKIYSGKELYQENIERHKRYYCIYKRSLLTSNLILIAFLILKNLLIIHISPCNKNSKEGKRYYDRL